MPVALSLAGAVWCGAILARPRVNQKGVGALLTVFAGWGLALIVTLAQKAASGGMGYTVASPASSASPSSLRSPSPSPRSSTTGLRPGPRPGIAALALSGIMGLFLAFGISQGASGPPRPGHDDGLPGQPIVMDAERYRIKALPRPGSRPTPRNSIRSPLWG